MLHDTMASLHTNRRTHRTHQIVKGPHLHRWPIRDLLLKDHQFTCVGALSFSYTDDIYYNTALSVNLMCWWWLHVDWTWTDIVAYNVPTVFVLPIRCFLHLNATSLSIFLFISAAHYRHCFVFFFFFYYFTLLNDKSLMLPTIVEDKLII